MLTEVFKAFDLSYRPQKEDLAAAVKYLSCIYRWCEHLSWQLKWFVVPLLHE